MGYLKMFCLFFKIRDTFLDVFLSLISDVTPLWPGSISCAVSTLFSGLSPLFLAGHMPRGMFHKHLEGTRPLPCCAQRPRRAGRGEGPWPAAAPRPPLAPPSPGAAPCTPPVTCHDPRPLPGRGRHRVTHASGRESARPSPVPSAETRHTSGCCGVSVLGSAPIGGPGQPGLTLGGPQSHLDGASFALMTQTPSLTAFKVSPLSPI